MFESNEIRSLLEDAAAVQSKPLLYDFKREIIHFQKSDDACDRFIKYKAIGCKEAGNHEGDFAFEEIEQIYHDYLPHIRVPKGEADSSELLLSLMNLLYSDEVMKCCPSCDTFNSTMTSLSKMIITGRSSKSVRQLIKNYAADPDLFKKSLHEVYPFFDVGYSIGNFLPVPTGWNAQKGTSSLTKDYTDLTLKIIYDFYVSGNESILRKFLTEKHVHAAKVWLGIFGTWDAFVAQNYIQDYVGSDNLPLELWDGHFSGNILPTHEEALAYFRNAAKRIALRGERMVKVLGDKL